MASTIPSSFRRGEKKSATGSNNLRTAKAAFASSPQLPQIRKSGESIAAKKSAIELRIDLVNKSEYNFEDREQHFLPFASASRFWVLTSPCPELDSLRFVARGSCCAAAFRFMVSRNRVVRASSRTDSRLSRVLCGGLSVFGFAPALVAATAAAFPARLAVFARRFTLRGLFMRPTEEN
jgi:hypothetical protein